VGDKVKLTLGLKLEHNDYTGTEHLPNARLAWDVAPNHLLWGAVSRAVRTPSRIDRELFSPGLVGGSAFRSEVARVTELGYRGQPRPALSYSVTVFRHDFDKLRSLDIQPGGATFNNNFEGHTSGVEAWGSYRASEGWRLNAGYAHLRQRFQAAPGTAPIGGVASLGNDPRNRWVLGSWFDLGASMDFDVQLRYVGKLPNPAVPAYTAIDMRLGWQVRPDLELSLTVRNLGDARHPEWGSAASRVEVGRNVFLRAVWRM
jgi:iron complex outermembrane receptor protein